MKWVCCMGGIENVLLAPTAVNTVAPTPAAATPAQDRSCGVPTAGCLQALRITDLDHLAERKSCKSFAILRKVGRLCRDILPKRPLRGLLAGHDALAPGGAGLGEVLQGGTVTSLDCPVQQREPRSAGGHFGGAAIVSVKGGSINSQNRV